MRTSGGPVGASDFIIPNLQKTPFILALCTMACSKTQTAFSLTQGLPQLLFFCRRPLTWKTDKSLGADQTPDGTHLTDRSAFCQLHNSGHEASQFTGVVALMRTDFPLPPGPILMS